MAADTAFTGAELGDFVKIVGGVNTVRTGNTPPNVPNVIWNFSTTELIGPFSLSATVRQVGTRWGDNGNTRLVEGFTTIDAAIGYGVIASRMERASRWNRWLYHGFYSLYFPFLYYKRPLWDAVVF